MKTSRILAGALAIVCIAALTLNAADKKRLGGPRGGRLLEGAEPKAEFFVEKDHTVTIAFYGSALKPIAATGQNVTVIVDASGSKTKLEFEKKGDVLVSKTKLPTGGDYNVVVQLRQTAGAMPQNFRFKLDLATCGGCKRPEYACICDE
jgi:hypothetical protein